MSNLNILDIKLKKIDKIYKPGNKVAGYVVVNTKEDLSHSGLTLTVEGSVQLQLSSKSVGIFEAFYNSLKPITMLHYTFNVAPSGKLYQLLS